MWKVIALLGLGFLFSLFFAAETIFRHLGVRKIYTDNPKMFEKFGFCVDTDNNGIYKVLSIHKKYIVVIDIKDKELKEAVLNIAKDRKLI